MSTVKEVSWWVESVNVVEYCLIGTRVLTLLLSIKVADVMGRIGFQDSDRCLVEVTIVLVVSFFGHVICIDIGS